MRPFSAEFHDGGSVNWIIMRLIKHSELLTELVLSLVASFFFSFIILPLLRHLLIERKSLELHRTVYIFLDHLESIFHLSDNVVS